MVSIMAARRTSMPCLTISWMAGAYRRRSSGVHAMRVVLPLGSTDNGMGGHDVRDKTAPRQRLSFRQGLRARPGGF